MSLGEIGRSVNFSIYDRRTEVACHSEMLMNSSNSAYISNPFITAENHANIERLIIHIRII